MFFREAIINDEKYFVNVDVKSSLVKDNGVYDLDYMNTMYEENMFNSIVTKDYERFNNNEMSDEERIEFLLYINESLDTEIGSLTIPQFIPNVHLSQEDQDTNFKNLLDYFKNI